MPESSKISFGYGRTLNIGGFESVKVENSEEINLQSGEDVNAAYAALVGRVIQRVDSAAKLLAAKATSEQVPR